MKRLSLFIAFGIIMVSGYGQELTVDDFLDFSSVSSKKLENSFSKKGFIPAGRSYQNDTIVNTWQQAVRNPDSTKMPVARRVSKYQNGKEIYYSFQTSSADEYLSAINKLKQEGFIAPTGNINIDTSLLFQRKNVTVQGYSYTEDSISYYSLFFQRKPMPSPRSIIYANDLLQFTSHEYLVALFGNGNVKKDLYYFSDKEINKCSVLFPNTPRQAVFIWEDESTLTGLSHIIIGGSVRTMGSSEFNQQISENSWRLDNGIHFNMRLEELLEVNGEDLTFYGRNSEYFLTLVPQNKGQVDLSSTCIVLDCINCEGAPLLDKPIISASEALDQDIRLHVGMIILMPPANGNNGTKYARR